MASLSSVRSLKELHKDVIGLHSGLESPIKTIYLTESWLIENWRSQFKCNQRFSHRYHE